MFKSPRLLLPLIALALPALRLSMAEESGGGAPANPPANPPASPPATPDVDALVQAALAKQQSEFAAQFEKATGHKTLDEFTTAKAKAQGEFEKLNGELEKRLASAQSELDSLRISSAIASAASSAIDPQDVVALLGGKALVKDGIVTIDGKPVAEAVAAFLAAKPHLVKAGPAGSGAGAGGSGGNTKTKAEFDQFTPAEKTKFSVNGGKIVG